MREGFKSITISYDKKVEKEPNKLKKKRRNNKEQKSMRLKTEK